MAGKEMKSTYYLSTKSEVITGKSQTEALMYWPSDNCTSSIFSDVFTHVHIILLTTQKSRWAKKIS